MLYRSSRHEVNVNVVTVGRLTPLRFQYTLPAARIETIVNHQKHGLSRDIWKHQFDISFNPFRRMVRVNQNEIHGYLRSIELTQQHRENVLRLPSQVSDVGDWPDALRDFRIDVD